MCLLNENSERRTIRCYLSKFGLGWIANVVVQKIQCSQSGIALFLKKSEKGIALQSTGESTSAFRGNVVVLKIQFSQSGIALQSTGVVVDFTTVDPFALCYRDDVLLSTNGHLNKAEDRKRDKYTEILNDLNNNLYSKFSFVPFCFSIFGNIGQSALNFLNDFDNLCRSSGENFAGNLWKNRIIFALYRSVPK
ncbi:hypothetical protein P9112_013205 [Eukaryota sp. TZLM1-RC]